MRALRTATFALMAAAVTSWAVSTLASEQAKLVPEDLVARHLMSIGSAEGRAAVKSRVAEGTVRFQFVVGGTGTLEGKEWLVSEGRKLQLMMKLSSPNYRGERFVCDGDRVEVASISAGVRSLFGQFIHGQELILREGLMGGVLSTAWPLLSLDQRKPRLTYDGLRKIEDRDLYQVHYMPRKGSDLEIHLYFEPETFHHVLTVYTLTLRPRIGSTEIGSARQQETSYRLEERFSDFKTVDGVTLPMRWDIRFTAQIPAPDTSVMAKSSVLEWGITQNQITNNVSLDPRNFMIK